MRGVHGSGPGCLWPAPGSSPHARGPLNSRVRLIIQHRIIPACAGSTKWHHPQSREPQDHPRMRGVHPCFLQRRPIRRGSSPHARGPHLNIVGNDDDRRIIPACAGSTLKKARKNAILEGITIPFHLTSQTQPLSTGNLPTPDVPVFPVPDDQQPQTICNLA